jgi:protocatechuate 3,4-dioxygenase, alpha subunit
MTDVKKPTGITPSATVGPYFKYGLTPRGAYPWNDAFSSSTITTDTVGEKIVVAGRVVDGGGAAVPDALLEIWQADASGRFAHPRSGAASNSAFQGFARTDTDKDGCFRFETIKPGRVAAQQAPHIVVAVFARGMLRHIYTRIYFADEASANATDPILALVPAARRETLLAQCTAAGTYAFDVRLQGTGETVFFDV